MAGAGPDEHDPSRHCGLDGGRAEVGPHVELSRLRTAVVRHLHAERDQLAGLRQTTRRITRDGQPRLLALVDELLSATDNNDGTCNCLVRAAEIELMLRRQSRLESAMLGRADHPPPGR